MKYFAFALNDFGHEGIYELDDGDMLYEREMTAAEVEEAVQTLSWALAEQAASESGANLDLSEGELEDWLADEAERQYRELYDALYEGERLYYF